MTEVTEPAEAEPEPEPDAVVIAYVYDSHKQDVAYSFHRSVIELIGYDLASHGYVVRGGHIAFKCSTDGLADGRNKVVELFLDNYPQVEWLFWVDTDMGFHADTLERLMAAADPEDRPVVGALAFTQQEAESDGMGGWRCRAAPTVFDWAHEGDKMGFAVRWNYAHDILTRVAGTGSACILVHRSVFERIEEKYGRAWYDRVPNASMGQILSEDLSFCLRAGTLGIPVHVHTGVKTSHQKTLWLAEDDYYGQVALSRLPAAPPAAPATDAVAVVVPVLGRPHHAARFMDSLRATTDMALATVYAVGQGGDEETMAAWEAAGATVLDSGEQVSFAAKCNLAYAKTAEPWLFLVGSDVRFHPGWLDHAQAAATDGVHVVGTNDLGNPRVIAGEHATHLLVRRAYVDDQGASWDGPGVVCHEGYRHWWVDQEIVDAAKQRGVWAMALASRVEHLHPAWGKAPMDAVYELAARHVPTDRKRFEERLTAFGGQP